MCSKYFSTYDSFPDGLQDTVRRCLRQHAHLCQSTQCQLLSLCGFFQIGREFLKDLPFLLQAACWVKLRHSNFTDAAVTDEATETKYVCDDSLIVCFAEHKRDELANSCEQHHHMVCVLCRVLQT